MNLPRSQKPDSGRVAMEIERRIRAALSPAAIAVEDDSAAHAGHAGSSGGGHFSALVVSEQFQACPLVQRHRMVYDAVGELLQREVHALALKTLTPEEHAEAGTKENIE